VADAVVRGGLLCRTASIFASHDEQASFASTQSIGSYPSTMTAVPMGLTSEPGYEAEMTCTS
jgi:hypothetical protein